MSTITTTIPVANTLVAGVIDTGTQSFAGAKTFTTAITANLTGTAANSTLLNNKSEANLNVNNSTNFASQAQSYYLNATNINAGTLAAAYIVSANSTANGAVNTIAQTWAGAKTFSGGIVFDSASTGNAKLVLNTTNGRLVLPVGANKWAT